MSDGCWLPKVIPGLDKEGAVTYVVLADLPVGRGLVVKIGSTTERGYDARMRVLSNGSPVRLTPVIALAGAYERYLHWVYEPARQNGEWFRFFGEDRRRLLRGTLPVRGAPRSRTP